MFWCAPYGISNSWNLQITTPLAGELNRAPKASFWVQNYEDQIWDLHSPHLTSTLKPCLSKIRARVTSTVSAPPSPNAGVMTAVVAAGNFHNVRPQQRSRPAVHL